MATALRTVSKLPVGVKSVPQRTPRARDSRQEQIGRADTPIEASNPRSRTMSTAHDEDLEAARTVSSVLFGVLIIGISIGGIGFICSFLFT